MYTKSSKNTKIEDKNKFAALSLFNEAENLRNHNRSGEAAAKYLNALLIDKTNPSIYIGLAAAYRSLNCASKAYAVLEKASQLHPDDTRIKREFAVQCLLDNNAENGLRLLREAVKLEPDNPDIQLQLAAAHQIAGEDDMALMIYHKINETHPEYLRAYIQAAVLYMHLEDYLSSAKLFRIVIKLAPEYYRAYSAMGICCDKLGSLAAAKRYYKKYLKYAKNDIYRNEIIKRLGCLKTPVKSEGSLRLVSAV